MRDRKMKDQFARLENTKLENAGTPRVLLMSAHAVLCDHLVDLGLQLHQSDCRH